jgi:hypothetical protein
MSQNTFKCNNCALIVDSDDNFCRKCGYVIKSANNLLDNAPNDILTELYENLKTNIKDEFCHCIFKDDDLFTIFLYINIKNIDITLNIEPVFRFISFYNLYEYYKEYNKKDLNEITKYEEISKNMEYSNEIKILCYNDNLYISRILNLKHIFKYKPCSRSKNTIDIDLNNYVDNIKKRLINIGQIQIIFLNLILYIM